MVQYLLRVLHSLLESIYSPGWHSHVTIPNTDVTVRMLSGQAQE